MCHRARVRAQTCSVVNKISLQQALHSSKSCPISLSFLLFQPRESHLFYHPLPVVSLISDPRRGRYMGLFAFIPPPLFFLPRFCPGHISGTVTRRDSKLSVLLGPAV